MDVLFDTNVILDVLLARQPWFDDGSRLWKACDNKQLNGFLTATTLTDIFYIARRHIDRDRAFQAVRLCLQVFTICTVNTDTLLYALNLRGIDFEDNVQIACAVRYRCTYIVTRDVEEFALSPVKALTPSESLSRLFI